MSKNYIALLPLHLSLFLLLQLKNDQFDIFIITITAVAWSSDVEVEEAIVIVKLTKFIILTKHNKKV